MTQNVERAGADWEARWISAEGALDPGYERTNAALRRWIDGMEQALLRTSAIRRPAQIRGQLHAVARGLTLSQTPSRR
jgi:hypothetical protein